MPDIHWKLHLRSSPPEVFEYLTSPELMEEYWAEKVLPGDQTLTFHFSNGQRYQSRIIKKSAPYLLEIDYFESIVRFELKEDDNEGTDLLMHNREVPQEDYQEVFAGWVSVLLALKAAVDFKVDLRNHDPDRTWDQRYVEN